jgi:hypothetical protein
MRRDEKDGMVSAAVVVLVGVIGLALALFLV